jgi:hypothetical protein
LNVQYFTWQSINIVRAHNGNNNNKKSQKGKKLNVAHFKSVRKELANYFVLKQKIDVLGECATSC